MKGKYLKGRILEYDGSQLSPLWAYKNVDLKGDGIVCFRGPCEVRDEYMVDMEDAKEEASITARDMLHFVVELFGFDITGITLVQRLLLMVVMETIRDSDPEAGVGLVRENHNIFASLPEGDQKRKLTISVATVSPVSGLIHMGINISNEGTPVPTAGLNDLGITGIDDFAVDVLRRFIHEMRNLRMDACKVRPVY